MSYLGETEQITQRSRASSTVVTNWGYLPNSGDRRRADIGNTGFSGSQFSNYQFATTPENFISAITETSDSTAVYPSALAQTASYNNLNQLTNLSGQALTYDAVGNLTSDGLRNYSWDAENRLMAITYPGQPGKQTAFAYDGMSRRVAISSTPAGGGSAVTTSYLWCNMRICQARNAANAASREYLAEGEFVPGSPGQPYVYGTDQIGSVRRAFVDATTAPAFSYDPYGNAMQATTPVTDFAYAGMFYNADSGLYLTQFRAYDPVAGRWLSRDPLGEFRDQNPNLYVYVNNDPLNNIDLAGLYTLQLGLAGSGTLFGPTFQFGGGVVIDTSGGVGLYGYGGVGGGGGAHGDLTGSIQFSNAKTIYDLSGLFANTSLHGGAGLGGSVDFFTGFSENGPVAGGGITGGISAGASASLTLTQTEICGLQGCQGPVWPLLQSLMSMWKLPCWW